MSSPGPARWQRLGHEVRLTTRIFDVHGVRYRHPSRGTEREFIVVRPPDWVNVVAVTPDARIVLVRQFRFGIDGFSLEIPGGMMDPDEQDPVATARRELREETGYAGGAAHLLGSVHPNPAIQSNRSHFVLIEGAVPGYDLDWDPDEELVVETRPEAEVFRLAETGGITHALVLNALLLYRAFRREGGAAAV